MTLRVTRPAPPAGTAPVESMTALVRELVRTPSQGGIDDYGAVVDVLTATMRRMGLDPRVLTDDGAAPVAVVSDVEGRRPGPTYVLDACLDTADIGDPDAWTADPFSGEVRGGWLYGRGAADSKAAVSVFCHLAAELSVSRDFGGTLSLLFDLDEHTGGFAGIRHYVRTIPRLDGVMIGYPGTGRVVTGGRGFCRARVTVHGEAAHTGGTSHTGINAVSRAARLAAMLDDLHLDTASADDFPHPPKVAVTAVRAGRPGGYSVVPDRADLDIDVRLTPTFTAAHAQALLVSLALELDRTRPAPRPTTVRTTTSSWPAFALPEHHPLPGALLAGARSVGLNPRPGPAGPSNIGCYLAARGIPTTAGFGVDYRGMHGTDEAIDLATLPPVYGAYRAAVLELLNGPDMHENRG